MSDYVIREGIVLTSICGQYLLVSTIANWEKCPYVKRINESIAYFFGLMQKGYTVEEMAESAIEEYDIDDKEEVINDIKQLINQLKDAGYLLSDEEINM